MGGQYQLDFKESSMLQEKMKLIPDEAEKLVNDVLHTKGSKQMMMAIISFMPMSSRNKRHAKNSNPLKIDKLSLGFIIYPKGGAAKNKNSFGYLVFPDEGRGSSNPFAHRFFEKGVTKEKDRVLEGIILALEEASNKSLGN